MLMLVVSVCELHLYHTDCSNEDIHTNLSSVDTNFSENVLICFLDITQFRAPVITDIRLLEVEVVLSVLNTSALHYELNLKLWP